MRVWRCVPRVRQDLFVLFFLSVLKAVLLKFNFLFSSLFLFFFFRSSSLCFRASLRLNMRSNFCFFFALVFFCASVRVAFAADPPAKVWLARADGRFVELARVHLLSNLPDAEVRHAALTFSSLLRGKLYSFGDFEGTAAFGFSKAWNEARNRIYADVSAAYWSRFRAFENAARQLLHQQSTFIRSHSSPTFFFSFFSCCSLFFPVLLFVPCCSFFCVDLFCV